jgi:hypothetical protein
MFVGALVEQVGNRLCPKTDNDDINYEKKRNLLKPFFTG